MPLSEPRLSKPLSNPLSKPLSKPVATLGRLAALEAAVSQLLAACDLDGGHKDLVGTPRRVAKLWSTDVLAGYAADASQILGDFVEGEGRTELVVIRGIPCHGMCPHHLMPWTAEATVAYLPGEQLLGFGRLADLVNCFTRRLTLQERACNEIADALMCHLDARGSACVIQGTHTCLTVPGDKHGASVVTSSYRGAFNTRADLQRQLVG
ncbi:MAG: GTP cyclohydrolase I [Nannocystaceae bacterium]